MLFTERKGNKFQSAQIAEKHKLTIQTGIFWSLSHIVHLQQLVLAFDIEREY